MYRYLAEGQKDPFSALSNRVAAEYPGAFRPITEMKIRPHVSIMSIGEVKRFTRENNLRYSRLTSWSIISSLYAQLAPNAPETVLAECQGVDYVGNSVAIILGSRALEYEIGFSSESMGAYTQLKFHNDDRAHVSIGRYVGGHSRTIQEDILDFTFEVGQDLLPPDMLVNFGSLSLTRPRSQGPQENTVEEAA